MEGLKRTCKSSIEESGSLWKGWQIYGVYETLLASFATVRRTPRGEGLFIRYSKKTFNREEREGRTREEPEENQIAARAFAIRRRCGWLGEFGNMPVPQEGSR